MGNHPEKLSDCPIVIDTKTNGFEQDLVELLDQSLEFTFLEGRETHHAFPHTTGWRTLPFSVLTYVLSQSGILWTEEHTRVDLGPGDAYLIPIGQSHRSDALAEEGVSAIWMHFTFRLLGGLDLFSLIDSPGEIPASKASDVPGILAEIIDVYSSPSNNPLSLLVRRRVAVDRLLAFILDVCCPRADAEEMIVCSQRLKPALTHIHQNYAKPICRDELAEMTNLSRSRFHTLFHQLTGLGPMDYLKHRRIQAAQTLLLTTDMKIREITSAVGYDDPLHFTRQFAASVGCCPRAFRQQQRTWQRIAP